MTSVRSNRVRDSDKNHRRAYLRGLSIRPRRDFDRRFVSVEDPRHLGVSRVFFLRRTEIGLDSIALSEVLAFTFPLRQIANVGWQHVCLLVCPALTAGIGPTFNFHRVDLFSLCMNAQACFSLDVLQGAKRHSNTAVIDLRVSMLDKRAVKSHVFAGGGMRAWICSPASLVKPGSGMDKPFANLRYR